MKRPGQLARANRPSRAWAVSLGELLLRRRCRRRGRSGAFSRLGFRSGARGRRSLARSLSRRSGSRAGGRRRGSVGRCRRSSSRSRRSCSLVGAGRFLLRAGRQQQRRNERAKSKFCVHRSVPREARVVLIRLRPLTRRSAPLTRGGGTANSIEIPLRLETKATALRRGCRAGATAATDRCGIGDRGRNGRAGGAGLG
jgi:hypothetical protein